MRIGSWQRQTLRECAQEPGDPLGDLQGAAKNWAGSYRQSLRKLEAAGLLERGFWGPKGGVRWSTTEKGKAFINS